MLQPVDTPVDPAPMAATVGVNWIKEMQPFEITGQPFDIMKAAVKPNFLQNLSLGKSTDLQAVLYSEERIPIHFNEERANEDGYTKPWSSAWADVVNSIYSAGIPVFTYYFKVLFPNEIKGRIRFDILEYLVKAESGKKLYDTWQLRNRHEIWNFEDSKEFAFTITPILPHYLIKRYRDTKQMLFRWGPTGVNTAPVTSAEVVTPESLETGSFQMVLDSMFIYPATLPDDFDIMIMRKLEFIPTFTKGFYEYDVGRFPN